MEIKVVIPDEKKNDQTLKRMDLLERKLDQQYKAFTDKSDYVKAIDKLQSSFANSFNRMFEMNKVMMANRYKERIDLLREEFSRKLKSLEKENDNKEIELFTSKLSSFENAIKNITLKPQIVRVSNGNNNKVLFNSFNTILARLENLIRQSRPRVFPSPS